MSLFKTLYDKRLDNSSENFFTEIVSSLFRRNPEILYKWLTTIKACKLPPQCNKLPVILTQQKYDSCRLDFLIEFEENDCKTAIIVESKTSFQLGLHDQQLERYASLLHNNFGHFDRRVLIFISHTYEPVDRLTVLKDIPAGSVDFIHTSWNDFYHILKYFREDTLAGETSQFMEDLGMAYDDQFTAVDLSALDIVPKLFNLTEHCLSGEVLAEFAKLTGKKHIRAKYLDGYGRYILSHEADNWSLQMGFFFGEDDSSGPRIGFEFYVKSTTQRSKFALLLIDLLNLDNWEPYDWDGKDLNSIGPETEPCVFHTKGLKAFLEDDNNPSRIIDYFLQRINEFWIITSKKEYSKLPW